MAQFIVDVDRHAGIDKDTGLLFLFEDIAERTQTSHRLATMVVVGINERIGSVGMYHLTNKCVNTHVLDEDSVLLPAVGEEFSEYNDGWIDLTCLAHKVLTDSQWRPVTVVQTETVEVLGHKLNIYLEASPEFGGVFLFCPESKLGEITPEIHIPAKVMEIIGCSKVFKWVAIHDPSVVEDIVTWLDLREGSLSNSNAFYRLLFLP